MRSYFKMLKHIAYGVHNIPKIIFGTGRLVDEDMKKRITSGELAEPLTVDEDLCMGCGVCANICPTKAITMRETGEKIELTQGRYKEKVPVIEHIKCVYCFQCHDTCPVFTVHKKPAAIHPRGIKVTGIKAQELFKQPEGDEGV